jgi:RNA polymerase sigma-70 factor, ECF subfamily
VAPERLPVREGGQRSPVKTGNARVVELLSRHLDDDLSAGERSALDRVLANDARAATALAQLRDIRGRLVLAFAAPPAAPQPGGRLPDRLWDRLSVLHRRPGRLDVTGRFAPQFEADFRLAQDAAQGDRRAWDAMFRTFATSISALVRRYGFEDEQEDIVQDIFLLLWRRIGTFRGDASLKTWVLRVAINFLNNYRRRVHTKRSLEVTAASLPSPETTFDVAGDEDLNPDRQLEHKTLRETIHAALALMPRTRQIAVVLRDLQELSYAEIGRILGIPEGTVKSRVARGRMALAAILLSSTLP